MGNIDKLKLIENAPKPYLPEKLPLDQEQFATLDILKLSSKAESELGKYSGFLLNLINPMLLISPLVTQEAVLSSKLEGTHATLEDLLNYQAGNKVDVEADELKEIFNYREALFYALNKISTISKSEDGKLPLTSRIIKEMHKILLNNVRGSSKNPGKFKRQQNYIGSLSSISYTPVPANLTDEYMNNLENYIHSEDISLLIQSAIIHAQFEMIHPFEDGNGRIGRLLIPLFLYYRELLPYPTFYMSKYFEKDRSLYISNLNNISLKGDWNSWIEYYLRGIIESANESTTKAANIFDLYNYMKNEIMPKLNSVSSIELLDFIFTTPIFSANQVSEKLNVSKGTSYNLINKLIDEKFIITDNSARNKTFLCPQILNLI